ncbi:Salivary acidic proline-rich phosphoprotein 1/2 [Elasticomyces elasticus]|nr:Salivary acidic proline-rich phosphoprotein 1/2 [Elasticomyces elasticus]
MSTVHQHVDETCHKRNRETARRFNHSTAIRARLGNTTTQGVYAPVPRAGFPVVSHYLDEPTDDVPKAATLKRIFEIHRKERTPCDILVFMTGQDMIQSLQKTI